jgi:iron complex outermembrane receptor protein
LEGGGEGLPDGRQEPVRASIGAETTSRRSATVSYTGEPYYSYENDGGRVDSNTVVDLALGYRFSGGWLEGLEVQGNVTNLFDEDYISTIGSGGFVARDPTGAAQTVLTAPPRQVFVTVKKAF